MKHARLAPVATVVATLAACLALSACATTGTSAPIAASSSAEPLGVGAPGVTTLAGIRYKVLKSGPTDGMHPRRSDEITVRYEGRLTSGKVFDSSAEDKTGTATFPLGKLIPGWIAALQLMRPGDAWELWIPAYMAYGEKGVGPIPPNTDLIFKVELVSIKPSA